MTEIKIVGKMVGKPLFWSSRYASMSFDGSKSMSLLLVDFFIEQDNGGMILSRANSENALKVGKLNEGDYIDTRGVISSLNNEITYMVENIKKHRSKSQHGTK